MLLITNGLDKRQVVKPNFFARRITQNDIKPIFKKEIDAFVKENIKAYELHNSGELKSIEYSKPQPVIEALKNLLATKLHHISYDLENSIHNKSEIKLLISDLKNNPQIANVNVKSLLALGLFAYVFETEDGNVLKLTARNHFPEDRAVEPFDVPIWESGKMQNGTYYYLEKKLSQDNLSPDEIIEFCKEIEAQGFILKDVLGMFGKVFVRQFGKDDNGKIYLLDPGCAMLEESRLPILKRIKRAIIEMVGMVFEDIT